MRFWHAASCMHKPKPCLGRHWKENGRFHFTLKTTRVQETPFTLFTNQAQIAVSLTHSMVSFGLTLLRMCFKHVLSTAKTIIYAHL